MNWIRTITGTKFRSIYGWPAQFEESYSNVPITQNVGDSNFCAVNPKFVAIVTDVLGGGAFLVIPIEKTGKLDFNCAKVTGHQRPVLDIKWDPFNDNIIASSSEDYTVKLWYIPDGGLEQNLTGWVTNLIFHTRKVNSIEWHPTAKNVLVSASFDHLMIVWDVGKGSILRLIHCHEDVIYSMSFNHDGSRIATTSKDRKLRIIDPRTGDVISEDFCQVNVRVSNVAWLGNSGRVLTTGFSKFNEVACWDENSLIRPLTVRALSSESVIIFPFFDQDTNILYLAGKSDRTIQFFEIFNEAPYIIFLHQYTSILPQKGFGIMPKRGCDVTQCEIFRLYKLHSSRRECEPISFIVRRKSDQFQDDLYPDTAAPIPAVSASDWFFGINRPPVLMSMKTVYQALKSGHTTANAHAGTTETAQNVGSNNNSPFRHRQLSRAIPKPANLPKSPEVRITWELQASERERQAALALQLPPNYYAEHENPHDATIILE